MNILFFPFSFYHKLCWILSSLSLLRSKFCFSILLSWQVVTSLNCTSSEVQFNHFFISRYFNFFKKNVQYGCHFLKKTNVKIFLSWFSLGQPNSPQALAALVHISGAPFVARQNAIGIFQQSDQLIIFWTSLWSLKKWFLAKWSTPIVSSFIVSYRRGKEQANLIYRKRKKKGGAYVFCNNLLIMLDPVSVFLSLT